MPFHTNTSRSRKGGTKNLRTLCETCRPHMHLTSVLSHTVLCVAWAQVFPNVDPVHRSRYYPNPSNAKPSCLHFTSLEHDMVHPERWQNKIAACQVWHRCHRQCSLISKLILQDRSIGISSQVATAEESPSFAPAPDCLQVRSPPSTCT